MSILLEDWGNEWEGFIIRKIFTIKNLSFLLIALFLKWCSTGFIVQVHLSDNPRIGKEIYFKKPISYIIRETPSIVPIIAKIEKEITESHTPFSTEKENKNLSLHTKFIITDAYSYRDFLNQKTIYYILTNQEVKYILSEGTLNELTLK